MLVCVCLRTPRPRLQEECIVAAAAGAEHSLALTSEGTVYAFGAGDAGQLGRRSADYQREEDAFRPVAVATKLRIVQVGEPAE